MDRFALLDPMNFLRRSLMLKRVVPSFPVRGLKAQLTGAGVAIDDRTKGRAHESIYFHDPGHGSLGLLRLKPARRDIAELAS